MHASPRQGANPGSSQPLRGSLSLSSSEEPAAVHLYDLDTVFLSKTVVSLTDVFAHSVDGPFDLSPLYAPQRQGVEKQQQPQQAAATTASSPYADDAHCAPSTSGAAPAHRGITNLPFSGGSAPYTSSSPKPAARLVPTRAAALQPKPVERGADGRWRTVSANRGTSSTGFSTTTACSKPPSPETHARMLLVPLDTYHFLLTYHDVDLPGQLSSCCNKQAVTATVERLSAASPGRRPPRSGICVVRRLEGEQRDSTATASSAMAAPAGAASATPPTLSRIAHGLPLDAFDGWVRDYTAYGLSCNEAVLRAAWENKTRERAEAPSAMLAGAVVEVGELVASGHEATDSGDNSLCGSVDVAVVDTAGLGPPVSDASAKMMPTDGAAAAEGKEAATLADANAEQAATVSPSLDRLHCSSTTSSSPSAASTPSPPTERGEEGCNVGGVETATRVTGGKNGDALDAISASLMGTAAQQQQQKCVLWEEEQQRTERAAAQLRHRFLVSDSAQHAIWALEVRLPAMVVRALAPAEFYTMEVGGSDEEVPAAAKHSENDGNYDALATHGATDTREEPAAELMPGIALPRKKTASTITHGRAAPSGHRVSVKDSSAADASRLRSPSPANPSMATNASKADDRSDAKPDDSDARRFSTSVATHPASESCSTRRYGRSASSVNPSVAMALAVPTPLIGGARGFVDGHFSVARFNSPASLCWRIDEDNEDDDEKGVVGDGGDSEDDLSQGVAAAFQENHGRGRVSAKHHCVDPVSRLRGRHHCSILFISDMGNCAIRYANFYNRLVRTITGVDGVPGYRDGSCVSSLLRGATALAWCSAGLLFTDGANNVVRLITGIRKRRAQGRAHDNGEDVAGADAAVSLACSSTHATESEMQRPNELEVDHRIPAATERPRCVEDKSAGGSLDTPIVTATEPQDGELQALPPAPSSSPLSATRRGILSSSAWKRDGTASTMPRVWTLAGCTSDTDVNQPTQADSSLASYVDSVVPSRAHFGYISDMALWTDETGDTQVLLVDQTHHALRILDAHGGVSTYVGPLDYEVTSIVSPSTTSTPAADSLPPGLVFPCCLTVGALIKERSPALLSATTTGAATMLTPQPYLCSSSPLLFTASAVTGAVSVLLPISQRSDRTPWSVRESQRRCRVAETREGKVTCNGDNDDASVFAAIRGALELGVATEGRRSIGEAAMPSLKHVVVGWAADEVDGGDGAESAHAVRQLAQAANAQHALQYLRLRFPWLLPPSVPLLSTRIVAGCACHVSGKRPGATAAAAAPTAASNAVGLHYNTNNSSRQGTGAPSGVRPNCTHGKGSTATAISTSAVRPVQQLQLQQQRLLFQSPPRHPPIIAPRNTAATTGVATAPAAEMAALLLEPTLRSAAPPGMVEMLLDTHLGNASGDSATAGDRQALCVGSRSPSCGASPLSPNSDLIIEEGTGGSRHCGSSSCLKSEDGKEEKKADGGDVGGGRAVAKWLTPPMKSVSRSPSGSRSQGQPQPQLTYAGLLQMWTPEKRQQRLRSTQEISIPTKNASTSPCGTPRALHKQQQQQAVEEKGSPSQWPQSAESGSPQRSQCSPEQLLLRALSSSRSPRGCTTSPNNLSSCGSPPLTPRAMVAHQLMQRRRTSRSNTAPHVASVEGGGRSSTGSKRTAVADGQDGTSPPSETQQQEGSQGPAAPAEPLVVSAVPDRRTPQPCRADWQLHNAYDAAVRRLFRVYNYLATKTVTTRTTATASTLPLGAGAAGAGGSADPRIAVVESRRGSTPSPWVTHQPRQVVQYTMSFAAFFRFVVLTGYADCLAEVAAAAVTAAATDTQGKDGDDTRAAARDYSTPSPVSSLCRLSQVQQRRGGGGSGAGTRRWSSASASSPRAPTGATSTVTSSSLSHSRHPTSSDVLLVPLATTDTRAIAAVLYACGVRQKGYHTVTQMDFQSFRRAALLLYTWARTATSAETAKRSETADNDGAQSRRFSAHRKADRQNCADPADFAYVDAVPSLDALTSEEVVVAYAAVYERAARCIPALAMSLGPFGASKGGEDHNEANARDNARQRSDVLQHSHPVSSMRPSSKAPLPLVEVDTDSPGATPSYLRCFEEAIGYSQRGVCVGGKAAGVDEPVTPPVSPIATTGAADDVSCFVFDGADSVKSPTAVAKETKLAGQCGDDAAVLFPPCGLTPHEILALDELLRLLQRNESTLRQLFTAYSVPITVHRSPQYEAPLSAAAAAASSSCSLLMSSPEVSLVLRGGERAVARHPRHAPATPLASACINTSPAPAGPPAVPHCSRQAVGNARATPSTRPAAATAVAPLGVVHGSAALSGVSTSQQDIWWKVQQLYTTSSLENKETYELTSHVLPVVPFKLFVELWRTLDVFPSLIRSAAMQQAFCDALTMPMLRGLTPPPGSTSDAAFQRQGQPPLPSLTRSADPPNRRTVELLCAHGGLPYACFAESFVRVALTVFAHKVDRIAYPTAAAKTAGLMQWCNKQVTLGLVAKRVQQQLSVTVVRRHEPSRRSSTTPTDAALRPSAAAAAATTATISAARATRAAAIFPDQLRLFCLPTAPKSRAAPPGEG
ncbi:hypothetical protein Q4I28_006967 [Leishmania naiffi]|uniref:Uncharacterized protein n=1 Tax=Leishmania naiffi TaxID=5678 RepID=A0AAW3BB37_9TRYP